MNTSEFNDLKTAIFYTWPSVSRWLLGLDPSAENPGDPRPAKDAQLAIWEKTLSNVEFNDASRAIELMSTGELEGIGQWETDREKIAILILRHAKGLASDRRHDEQERLAIQGHDAPAADANAPTFSITDLYRRACELRDLGASDAEVRATLDAEIPASKYTPRYRCPECQDSGFIQVWRPEMMRLWKKHRPELIPRKDRRLCVTACRCEAGYTRCQVGPLAPSRGAPRPKLIPIESRYDDRKWCASVDKTDDDCREFYAWCESFNSVENHANYDAALASFND